MSREDDEAFLENYAFMLSTGESHWTAATRFGVSANTLQRRLERVRLRVVDRADLYSRFGRIETTIQHESAPESQCGNTGRGLTAKEERLHE